MLGHEFMRNAYLAGTFVALACGVIGYFVVLRAQVFAGDALSHVAFAGALGAAAIGIDIRLGLFAATLVVGAGLGVPVRVLGIAFFVILGAVAAEATQAVGALLLLGLLAAPGGAARLLTDRPWFGLGLSAVIAVGSMWLGLLLSYEIDSLPAGTAVISVATAVFLLAAVRDRMRARASGRPMFGISGGMTTGPERVSPGARIEA
jgi:zinc/manganese transport system permease protein